jgi:hypothetical protein
MPSKSSSRILTDHDEIRSWAEERGAKPAAVQSTASDEDPGIIRLDFPGYSGAGSLEEIEWDEWFEKFDENNLALIVQEQTANGQKSNFNKLANREHVDAAEVSSSRGKRTSESGHSTRKSGEAKSASSNLNSKKSNSSGKSSQAHEGSSEARTSHRRGTQSTRHKSPKKAA